MHRFFLIFACIPLGLFPAFSQENMSEQDKDRAYWETVLDAYSAFVQDAILVRDNKASADILHLHKERISALLQHRRGRMTPAQQARFQAISGRYGGEALLSIPASPPAQEPSAAAVPATPKKARKPVKAAPSAAAERLPALAGIKPHVWTRPPQSLVKQPDVQPYRPSEPVWDYPVMMEETPSWHFLLAGQFGWAPEWNVGLKLGALHPSGLGMYVSGRFHPSRGISDTYILDTETLFESNGAYQTAHLYGTAGVLKQWRRPILYAGVGYGYRRVYWQDSAAAWAEIPSRSVSGIVLETGVMLPLGPVCLDAGISTLSFRTLGISLGIGVGIPLR